MEPALFHGSLPFVMENPVVSRGGRGMLDAFRARLLCTADWEADARSLGFEIDRKLAAYPSLWVKGLEPDEQSEDVVVVDVSGEGLATTGDRRQRKMKCGEQETSVGPNERVVLTWTDDEQGEETTGEPLEKVKRRTPKLDAEGEPVLKDITTTSGIMKRWVVTEAEVTLIDTYFATTKPPMAAVGLPFTPINPPGTPPYQWASYPEPLRGRHPHGWVLADRDADELFYFSDTNGLWRVTDTIVYRHPAFPD